jgi:hypothetical protein
MIEVESPLLRAALNVGVEIVAVQASAKAAGEIIAIQASAEAVMEIVAVRASAEAVVEILVDMPLEAPEAIDTMKLVVIDVVIFVMPHRVTQPLHLRRRQLPGDGGVLRHRRPSRGRRGRHRPVDHGRDCGLLRGGRRDRRRCVRRRRRRARADNRKSG